jgi:deoxycytidine triphosphate deaminase
LEGEKMSTLITERELRSAIETETFIKNGKVGNAEGIKYDFRMSSNILKAKFKRPINILNLTETEKAELFVEPGEVVFVLTEEVLNLPNNIQAILSPKRKLSHDGIMVLGGFCIDPLYEGRLLVGLYNFSSSPFPLLPGKKLIAAMFYRLAENEIDEFKRTETTINDFPDELIRLMERYSPVSIQSVMNEIINVKNQLEDFRKEFRDRENWFEKFQNSLDAQESKISKIVDLLDKEVDERKKSEEGIKKEILQYTKDAYKTAAIVGVIGALLITLLLRYIH